MIDQDDIKEALIELLGSNSKRGKKWFFPKNVDSEYKVFANMTLKEILFYILPALLLAVFIASIPPYSSVVFWIIKGLVVALVIVAPVAYIHFRPVKYRDNIRTKDYIKETIEYRKKQKVFYLEPKTKAWGEKVE